VQHEARAHADRSTTDPAEAYAAERKFRLLLSIPNSTIKENQMNPSTMDEIKGSFHEVKGTVKEKVGQVTNNPDLEDRGKAEDNAGVVEKKVGQIEKVVGK
jgi:uncharacterized protein YjbJ (UPF0337 family)